MNPTAAEPIDSDDSTPPSGEYFDSVLVGTSPLMLLEATRLGRAGKRVLLIDRRTKIGGAWCTGTLGGFTDLEMGCHYIERNDRSYRLIESIINQPMPDMDPQPFLLWRGFRFDRASTVPYYAGAVGEIVRGRDWRRLIRIVRNRATEMLSRLSDRSAVSRPKREEPGFHQESVTPSSPSQTLSDLDPDTRHLPYRYPADGCRQLIESLEMWMEGLDIKILLETSLTKILIGESNKAICQTTNGTFECGEIVLSSCTDLPEITTSGKAIKVQRSSGTQQHVILHLLGAKRRPFTYFEVANHPSLVRISDIGIYSAAFRRNAGSNELMICTHVSENLWNKVVDEDARATQVLADLIDVGALDGECQLLEHWCERFTTTVIREPELRALEEAASPHLRALYSYNFSVSFARYDATTPDLSPPTTTEDCC
jgi:hypothetical protein